MRRPLSIPLILTAPILYSCQRTPLIVEETYPDLVVSVSGMDVIDFGELEFGEVATRTILIENLGDLPLGIQTIALDGSGMPEHFSLSFDPDDISCLQGFAGEFDLDFIVSHFDIRLAGPFHIGQRYLPERISDSHRNGLVFIIHLDDYTFKGPAGFKGFFIQLGLNGF